MTSLTCPFIRSAMTISYLLFCAARMSGVVSVTELSVITEPVAEKRLVRVLPVKHNHGFN